MGESRDGLLVKVIVIFELSVPVFAAQHRLVFTLADVALTCFDEL